jgi:branched-chain amino acid transport system permease protein
VRSPDDAKGAVSVLFKARSYLAPTIFALLAFVPALSALTGNTYEVTLFSRIMIFATAAVGLNLIIGTAGLVSLGHALYIGLGAYSVGILTRYGLVEITWQIPTTVVVVLAISLVTGWISLRTRGLGFIMITMAFGQMFYYLGISLKAYGGDQGLVIPVRSHVLGMSILEQPIVFYYLTLTILALSAIFVTRFVASPFGLVLAASRQNERRVRTFGYSLVQYRLAAYVMSALVCGIAGFLLGNLTHFASPEYMNWTQSGMLIVMIILGGRSAAVGPAVGAVVILLLEETLSGWTDHWQAYVGIAVVAIALLTENGLYGFFSGGWKAER